MQSNVLFKTFVVLAAVLAFSSCQKTKEETEPTVPEIEISAGEVTDASISFTLKAKNAESAAYLVLSATAEEPSADDITGLGTEVSVTEAVTETVSDLAASTEYAVYAVAAKGDVFSEVKKLVISTLEEGTEIEKIECQASSARLVYYGETALGTGQFSLRLSEKGFSETASVLPESRYYSFTLYGGVPSDPENPSVPTGTFTFDQSGAGASGSFVYGSMTALTDANGETVNPAMIRSGSFTITEAADGYSIVAEVVAEEAIISGETIESHMTSHHVTFSGEIFVKSDAEDVPDEPDEPTVGPLDKNLENIEFTNVDYALYYGQTEMGLDNVLVAISNMQAGSDGLYAGPGQYMQLDLNTMFADNMIMDGRYSFGGLFSLTPGYTLENGKVDGTYVIDVDENGNMLIGLASSGSVTVTMTDYYYYEISIDLKTEDGYKMTGTFAGEIIFAGDTGSSTLTEDYIADFSGETNVAELVSWGDFYGCGHINWTLQIETTKEDGSFEGFSAGLIGNGMDEAAGLPAGTYKVYSDSEGYAPFRFMKGYVDYDYLAETGWYSKAEDGFTLTGVAPATDGTITVARDGDTYTISFELVDDSRHTFSGSWTGQFNNNGAYYAARKPSVFFPGRTR